MDRPTHDEDLHALRHAVLLLARAVRQAGGPDIIDEIAALGRDEWQQAEAIQQANGDERRIGHHIRLAQAFDDLRQALDPD